MEIGGKSNDLCCCVFVCYGRDMTTFKKGDRVRIADELFYNSAYRGKEAAVTDDTSGALTRVQPVGSDLAGYVSNQNLTLLESENVTLSRDELKALEEALEEALVRGDQVTQAQGIFDKYLHPTVTQTFTVTIEKPSRYSPHSAEAVRTLLVTGAFLKSDSKVTVEEVQS